MLFQNLFNPDVIKVHNYFNSILWINICNICKDQQLFLSSTTIDTASVPNLLNYIFEILELAWVLTNPFQFVRYSRKDTKRLIKHHHYRHYLNQLDYIKVSLQFSHILCGCKTTLIYHFAITVWPSSGTKVKICLSSYRNYLRSCGFMWRRSNSAKFYILNPRSTIRLPLYLKIVTFSYMQQRVFWYSSVPSKWLMRNSYVK